MKQFKIRFVFFQLMLFVKTFCSGQDLPPIVKYSSSIYGAGNQNWMISQDKSQFVYFANNEGLLEFNGSSWSLYDSPNESSGEKILKAQTEKDFHRRTHTDIYYLSFPKFWEFPQNLGISPNFGDLPKIWGFPQFFGKSPKFRIPQNLT